MQSRLHLIEVTFQGDVVHGPMEERERDFTLGRNNGLGEESSVLVVLGQAKSLGDVEQAETMPLVTILGPGHGDARTLGTKGGVAEQIAIENGDKRDAPVFATFAANQLKSAGGGEATTTFITGLRHEGKTHAFEGGFLAIDDERLAIGPTLTQHFQTRNVALRYRTHHHHQVAVAVMIDSGVEYTFFLKVTVGRSDYTETFDRRGNSAEGVGRSHIGGDIRVRLLHVK